MIRHINPVAMIVSEISRSLSSAVSGEDLARKSLLETSDFWFRCLLVATVFVAIGCFMEIGEAAIEWLQWRWHRKNKPFQEDGGRWTIPVSIVGLFLVIVGVGLEGYFEAKQASAETAIRAYDEAQTLKAQNEAAEAARQAGSAKESATQAHNAAIGAVKDEKQIREEEAKTAKDLKEASQELARASQLAKLVAKSVNPRMIDKKRFLQLMDGHPKRSADIWFESDDEEVVWFAQQLASALGPDGAGWNVALIPFPPKDSDTTSNDIKTLRRAADLDGMAMGSKDRSVTPTDGLFPLHNAINLSTGGWNISGLSWFFMQEWTDSTLCDTCVRIAIGPHRANVPIYEPTPKKDKTTPATKKP